MWGCVGGLWVAFCQPVNPGRGRQFVLNKEEEELKQLINHNSKVDPKHNEKNENHKILFIFFRVVCFVGNKLCAGHYRQTKEEGTLPHPTSPLPRKQFKS